MYVGVWGTCHSMIQWTGMCIQQHEWVVLWVKIATPHLSTVGELPPTPYQPNPTHTTAHTFTSLQLQSLNTTCIPSNRQDEALHTPHHTTLLQTYSKVDKLWYSSLQSTNQMTEVTRNTEPLVNKQYLWVVVVTLRPARFLHCHMGYTEHQPLQTVLHSNAHTRHTYVRT